MERKYSVLEIDQMRQSVDWLNQSSGCYSRGERIKEIEEKLRTYMLGGISPEDLQKAAGEAIQARWEAQKIWQERDRERREKERATAVKAPEVAASSPTFWARLSRALHLND